MARAGDGRTRSENRRRQFQINVKVTLAEYLAISDEVARRNRHLAPNCSQRARATMQSVLRDAVLTRTGESSAPTLPNSPDENDLRRAQIADLARLGNMLKTWLEYGDGNHPGKSPANPLVIHRGPTAAEAADALDILESIRQFVDELREQNE